MSTDYVDRREFSKLLLAGGAGALAGSATPSAADDVPEPEAADAATDERLLKDLSDSELVAELLRRRYPHENLTPDIVASIAADARGDLARGRILSRFPLTNADEPAFVFGAFRE